MLQEHKYQYEFYVLFCDGTWVYESVMAPTIEEAEDKVKQKVSRGTQDDIECLILIEA